VSWGKFVPESEGGRFAEVYADATTVWPLLIKGVLEEMEKPGRAHPPKPGGVAHGRLEEPRGPHAGGAPKASRGPKRARRVAAKPRP
jgi:hypothetical protein